VCLSEVRRDQALEKIDLPAVVAARTSLPAVVAARTSLPAVVAARAGRPAVETARAGRPAVEVEKNELPVVFQFKVASLTLSAVNKTTVILRRQRDQGR